MSNVTTPCEEQDVAALEHDEHAFCYDMTHQCHQDAHLINALGGQVQSGLASPDDAERTYQGRTV